MSGEVSEAEDAAHYRPIIGASEAVQDDFDLIAVHGSASHHPVPGSTYQPLSPPSRPRLRSAPLLRVGTLGTAASRRTRVAAQGTGSSLSFEMTHSRSEGRAPFDLPLQLAR